MTKMVSRRVKIVPRDDEYDHTVPRRSDGTRQSLRPAQPWPSGKPFKILSIDGGGILGILPCMVLAEIEKRFLGGEPIGNHFDMIVGTSTGGIIALGLGQGKSAQEVSKLYIERGRFIFPGNRLMRWLRGWAGWVFTPYDLRSLENELRREFGDGLFGSSSIPTCIPSFDGRYGEPYVFKTPHHPDYKKDQNERLVDVGLSTAAAPTIFAAVKRNGYSTNGIGWYQIDMNTGVEGDIEPFPTPQDLWARCFPEGNDWRDRFGAVPFETGGGKWQPRYYQHNGITAVLEAIAKGDTRILLTLATGTGKTSIAFQIAWKLFQSSWNLTRDPIRRPRILFLADRNILADQAYNAFSAFAPDALCRISPDEIRKQGRVPKNANVFFTIFQTFMTGSGEFTFEGYEPDFFDLIVIDECHRGGAKDESTWRGILEYFKPAVQLGLTATPKRDANADTYGYFGEPVYTYALKDGIGDGFLTPFKVRQMASTLDTYTFSDEDEVISGEIDPEKEYIEADFNTKLIIDEREKSRVEEFMDQIDQRQKTLVFCATQDHAARVRNFINQVKDNPDPHYCERVTADDGKLGEQHLREFQDNEKTLPTILTTSQKLSTGVDARNIRNIVLLRPIKSMIEFKQIIGRGTRTFDGKDFFTIYDFVKAYEHFNDPEWDGEPLPPDQPGPPRTPGEPPTTPPDPPGDGEDPPPSEKVVVKLADGKERKIRYVAATTYWSHDGRPITAQEFMDQLFGDLGGLVASEDELRAVWSDPEQREAFVQRLVELGYDDERMEDMRRLIDAPNSDVFDVLAYIRFTLAPLARSQRANAARRNGFSGYESEMREFLDYVLTSYVTNGVEELSIRKIRDFLRVRYGGTNDAKQVLGPVSDIRAAFVDIQQHLFRGI